MPIGTSGCPQKGGGGGAHIRMPKERTGAIAPTTAALISLQDAGWFKVYKGIIGPTLRTRTWNLVDDYCSLGYPVNPNFHMLFTEESSVTLNPINPKSTS